MSKLNRSTGPAVSTHEGAPARSISSEQELRRSVLACMLWENEFYESGEKIADRISKLVGVVEPAQVAAIAVEAREKMKLRHVPLLLCCELAKRKHLPAGLLATVVSRVIQRPDELGEILAIYSRGRTGTKKLNKISKQLSKGIAQAFRKFNEYSLAKYNRDGDIKLRDVLFLTHPKPVDAEQAALWKRLVEGKLVTPDTWEVALSGGADKKAAFTRLLGEDKLGALALLRNLRNMQQAGVDGELVKSALAKMDTERVLPFRFVAAARYAPQWEPALEIAMLRCLATFEPLKGKTAIVVDNSGSMDYAQVSGKSEMTRSDAACALAILLRGICEDCVVIGFGGTAQIIPARHGFALRDAIKAGPGGGTMTQNALNLAAQQGYDRIIVVTDEQSHQAISGPGAGKRGYFVNVASNQNGIGYGAWHHIDGWSEAILGYIREVEGS